MEKIVYNKTKDRQINRLGISEKTEPKLWEEVKMARAKIVDILSIFNDPLANLVINSESLDDVTTLDIAKALREVTLRQVTLYLY